MEVSITIDEIELKEIVVTHLLAKLNLDSIAAEHLKFEVKTKHNFKAEWEVGQFRMTFNRHY